MRAELLQGLDVSSLGRTFRAADQLGDFLPGEAAPHSQDDDLAGRGVERRETIVQPGGFGCVEFMCFARRPRLGGRLLVRGAASIGPRRVERPIPHLSLIHI